MTQASEAVNKTEIWFNHILKKIWKYKFKGLIYKEFLEKRKLH